MRSHSFWSNVSVAALLVLTYGRTAHAYSTGIDTTSFPAPAQGCNFCHTGGTPPGVILECVDCDVGPTVDPLSVHEFKLTITETGFQDHAGLNVSSLTGMLSIGGGFSLNTQTIVGDGGRDEITHNAPKPEAGGVIEFSFLWTAPAAPGVATLNAWGNAVNANSNTGGDAASFDTLDVGVGGPPPTPTATVVPSPALIDPYLSYKIRPQKRDAPGTPIPANIFPKDWVITADDVLIDDVDDPENFVVRKPKELLNAVTKDDGGAPLDPALHYIRYDMRLGKESVQPAEPDGTFPRPPKHVERIWQLDNAFGSVNVVSKKVKGLLLPAAADGIAPPGAAADATHYTCYQIKPTADITVQTPDKGDGTGRFRTDMQVYLTDSFFDDCALLNDGVTPSFSGTSVEGACLFNLKKPVELCNPIDKSAVVPPRNTTAVITGSTAAETESLLCYRVSLATKLTYAPAASLAGGIVGERLDPRQSKHVKRGQRTGDPIFTTPGNQFPGPVEVDTSKQYVACLPTDVIGFSPAP